MEQNKKRTMIVMVAMMAVVLLLAGCGKTPVDVPAVETEPSVVETAAPAEAPTEPPVVETEPPATEPETVKLEDTVVINSIPHAYTRNENTWKLETLEIYNPETGELAGHMELEHEPNIAVRSITYFDAAGKEVLKQNFSYLEAVPGADPKLGSEEAICEGARQTFEVGSETTQARPVADGAQLTVKVLSMPDRYYLTIGCAEVEDIIRLTMNSAGMIVNICAEREENVTCYYDGNMVLRDMFKLAVEGNIADSWLQFILNSDGVLYDVDVYDYDYSGTEVLPMDEYRNRIMLQKNRVWLFGLTDRILRISIHDTLPNFAIESISVQLSRGSEKLPELQLHPQELENMEDVANLYAVLPSDVAGTVRDITDGTVTITYENGEVYTLSW